MIQLMPFKSRTSGIRSRTISRVSKGRNMATKEIITDSNPMMMKMALIQPGIRDSAAIVFTRVDWLSINIKR